MEHINFIEGEINTVEQVTDYIMEEFRPAEDAPCFHYWKLSPVSDPALLLP